jgi:hypothetical protein
MRFELSGGSGHKLLQVTAWSLHALCVAML